MTFTAGLAAATLILGVGTVETAHAEVLRLDNGRTMHGTVDRGFIDEEYVKIKLFSTGGVVRVRWEHLIHEDRDQWQIDLGLKEEEDDKALQFDGHKLLFLNNDTRLGYILNPEAMEGPPSTIVRFQTQGKVEEYPRAQIARVDNVALDISQVYTPMQAYEAKFEQIQPTTGYDHHALAEYARKVGAYDKAKEHWTEAQDDDEFMATDQGRRVESNLARIDILIRNQALRAELDVVKRMLVVAKSQRSFQRAAEMYRDARTEVFRLQTENEDEAVQKALKIPQLAKRTEVERRKFFERHLPREVYRRLRAMFYSKSREKKVKDIPPGVSRAERAKMETQGTFEGARQYSARQAKLDLWNGIFEDVGATKTLMEWQEKVEKDPTSITEEDQKELARLASMEKSLKRELAQFWEDRSKKHHTTTSYGYGTFIVDKGNSENLKTKRKPRSNRGGRNSRGNRGGSSSKKTKQATTQDEWWEQANAKERQNWLLSYFAERSDVLEVVRWWHVDCDNCAGLGYKLINVAATGEQEAHRCTTCNGVGIIRKVKWR
jgi:hypothetical protein